MDSFEVVEVGLSPFNFESTLEDQFLVARLTKELEAATDIDQLREGAIKLLQLATMRQSVIRGLVRRLANLECSAIRTHYSD
jgi:hypothetical protein